MNTNAKINLLFIIASIALLSVLLLYPVIAPTAIHSNVSIDGATTTYGVVTGNQTIREDTVYNFNLTINHSGYVDINLTGVNISLPSVFSFINGTNGTGNISTTDGHAATTSITFTNFSSQLLAWNGTTLAKNIVTINDTAGFAEGKNNTFIWFNASATTPGKYNITVRFILNHTLTDTKFNETNITVIVNDTTRPDNVTVITGIDINSTTNQNVTGQVTVNVSVGDNGNFSLSNDDFPEIAAVNITLYNTTAGVNVSYNATNQTKFFTNKDSIWTFTFNSSAVPDGKYNLSITAIDQRGNMNGTTNISVIVDNTAPVVTATCSDTTSGNAFPCSCSASDGTSGIQTTTDSSDSPDGTSTASNTGSFTYSCTSTNYVGLSTTSTATYRVSQSGGSSSGGGGGGSSSTTYTKTVSIGQDFSKETSTTQQLGEKERIKIDIPASAGGTVTHYIGVKDIKTTTVVIEITSTPIILEIAVGDEMKVDVNDDGAYDLKVRLNKIENNKADIKIEYIQEKVPEEEKEEVAETGGFVEETESTPVEEKKSTLWVWITIIILVVIAIVVYIAVMMNKRKW